MNLPWKLLLAQARRAAPLLADKSPVPPVPRTLHQPSPSPEPGPAPTPTPPTHPPRPRAEHPRGHLRRPRRLPLLLLRRRRRRAQRRQPGPRPPRQWRRRVARRDHPRAHPPAHPPRPPPRPPARLRLRSAPPLTHTSPTPLLSSTLSPASPCGFRRPQATFTGSSPFTANLLFVFQALFAGRGCGALPRPSPSHSGRSAAARSEPRAPAAR